MGRGDVADSPPGSACALGCVPSLLSLSPAARPLPLPRPPPSAASPRGCPSPALPPQDNAILLSCRQQPVFRTLLTTRSLPPRPVTPPRPMSASSSRHAPPLPRKTSLPVPVDPLVVPRSSRHRSPPVQARDTSIVDQQAIGASFLPRIFAHSASFPPLSSLALVSSSPYPRDFRVVFAYEQRLLRTSA